MFVFIFGPYKTLNCVLNSEKNVSKVSWRWKKTNILVSIKNKKIILQKSKVKKH